MAALNVIVVILLLAADQALSSFTSTPAEFTPGKTKTVTLRCDPKLQEMMAILALHIRKKAIEAPVTAEQEGDPDQSTTQSMDDSKEIEDIASDDEDTLNSLELRRKKRSTEDFVRATITAGNNLDVVPSIERFEADGDVLKTVYMSVIIKSPNVNDIGTYECQVTYLDKSGIVRSSSEIVQVRETPQQSLDDLEARVKKLENTMVMYRIIITEQERVAKNILSTSRMVETDMEFMKRENEKLREANLEMKKQMSIISSRISSVIEVLSSENHGVNSGNLSANLSNNDEKQSQEQGELPGDNMHKVTNDLNKIATLEIMALAKSLKELRVYERTTQGKVIELELKVQGKLEERLRKLEDFKWQGTAESVEEMETKTLPLLWKDITDCKNNVTELQNVVFQRQGNVFQTSSSSSQAPASSAIHYTSPACFVCGNNATQKHCLVHDLQVTMECPAEQTNCITDVYQNGDTRHIYKRCATAKECEKSKDNSSPECANANFMKATAMECHFCCTSILCNEDIRPPKDLI